ncbi:MAG: GNAT family N-acetyltransferase [Pseudomonadales bacterium]|nr:GNAT family N-acetyltransferase [Pseudomonadales bacterium]
MLQGKLVILGPVYPLDFNALFLWADDSEAALLNEPYRPPLWKHQETFWFAQNPDPSRVFFALRKIHEPSILGYVQLWNIDAVNRSVMLGLRIGDLAQRGQGMGQEALQLAIDYCWQHLNLRRITISVFANNAPALHIYEKNGFIQEGLLRQAVYISGTWVDIILMGLLRCP